HRATSGEIIPVVLTGPADESGARTAERVDNGEALLDDASQPVRLSPTGLKAAEHTSALRRAMKAVLDVADLGSADLTKRVRAIQSFGYSQAADKLAPLEKRLAIETDAKARLALREAIALIRLKN